MATPTGTAGSGLPGPRSHLGELSYELANFTDEELADALVELGLEQNNAEADTPQWRDRAVAEFARARSEGRDAGVAMGRMRVRDNKPRLAQILWPVLERKVSEAADDRAGPPVYDLLETIRGIVSQLPSGSYLLDQPNPNTADDRPES